MDKSPIILTRNANPTIILLLYFYTSLINLVKEM